MELQAAENIANVFASQLQSILNSHSSSSHSSLHSSLQSSVTPSDISSIEFHEDDVLEALSHLKTGKSDGDGVSAEHLILATSALLSPLVVYFTSHVHDGFMPSCSRDCILIPVPKKKFAFISVNLTLRFVWLFSITFYSIPMKLRTLFTF